MKIKFVLGALMVAGVVPALSHAADKAMEIAVTSANPPISFEDNKGQLTGYDVDVTHAVLKQLDRQGHFVSMPFNALFAAVQSGRADMSIGAVTITNERLKSVSFSQPIIDSNQCIIERSSDSFKEPGDMSGHTLAAVTGSVGALWAEANQKKYGVREVRTYDGNIEPVLDLASKRVDAFVQDCPIIEWYVSDKPQFKVFHELETGSKNALMFAKDSPLVPEVDKALDQMKKDGTMATIYEKWYKAQPKEGSAVVTISRTTAAQ